MTPSATEQYQDDPAWLSNMPHILLCIPRMLLNSVSRLFQTRHYHCWSQTELVLPAVSCSVHPSCLHTHRSSSSDIEWVTGYEPHSVHLSYLADLFSKVMVYFRCRFVSLD